MQATTTDNTTRSTVNVNVNVDVDVDGSNNDTYCTAPLANSYGQRDPTQAQQQQQLLLQQGEQVGTFEGQGTSGDRDTTREVAAALSTHVPLPMAAPNDSSTKANRNRMKPTKRTKLTFWRPLPAKTQQDNDKEAIVDEASVQVKQESTTSKLHFFSLRQGRRQHQDFVLQEESKEEITSHNVVTVDAGAQPGAFSATSGGTITRNRNIQFSTVGHPSIPHTATAAEGPMLMDLVVASPVQDQDLPMAEHLDHDSHGMTTRNQASSDRSIVLLCIFAMLTLIVVVVVVVIVSAVVLTPNNNVTNSGVIQTASPALSPEDYFTKLLPQYTVQTMQDDPLSPQSQAFDFVIQDPQLYNYSDWRLQQRFALATLYYATKGDRWMRNASWLNYGEHECEWETNSFPCEENYILVSSPGGKYQKLDLADIRLKGPLPPELFGLLPSLIRMDLSSNDLEVAIPSEIGLLTALTYLDLSDNALSGIIASEIGLLSSLTYLDLAINTLSGPIPSQIGLLTLLYELDISSNALNGTIPSEIALLTALTALSLYSNELSGPIPSEMGLLRALKELYLFENALNGTVPNELGSLAVNDFFFFLDLRENLLLSGTVPNDLCSISFLRFDCTASLCGCGCTCS